MSLAAAYQAYPSKAAILTGIGRDIDARLFASLDEDPLDGSPKDRLFDLLMRRFDALNEHREAYAALAWELPRTPVEAAACCSSCAARSPTCWRRPACPPPACAAPCGSRGWGRSMPAPSGSG